MLFCICLYALVCCVVLGSSLVCCGVHKNNVLFVMDGWMDGQACHDAIIVVLTYVRTTNPRPNVIGRFTRVWMTQGRCLTVR